MRHNFPKPDLQFAASMRDIFAVDPAPATVTFEHGTNEIRQSLIRSGLLKPAPGAPRPADEASL